MSYGVDNIGAPTDVFVLKYLEGLVGVEVGFAAHNDVGITTTIRTAGIHDKPSPGVTHYHEDLFDHSLPWCETKSADFVFGSHVLEHLFNPIAALREHFRVARHYVVHTIPHPDRTFDKGRSTTTLEELLTRPSLPTSEMIANEPYGGHWNVWTPESFKPLAAHLGLRIVDVRDPDAKVGNGWTVVLEEIYKHGYTKDWVK
jgi:hypothetical protein